MLAGSEIRYNSRENDTLLERILLLLFKKKKQLSSEFSVCHPEEDDFYHNH